MKNKTTLGVFFILIFLTGCINQPEKLPKNEVYENIHHLLLGFQDIEQLKIGDTLKNVHLPKSNLKILINGSDYRNCYQTEINEITYYLGVTTENKVEYIRTSDTNFRTIEKLKVGDEYKTIKEFIKGNSLIHEPGWGIYQKLNSGWNASLEVKDFDNIGDLYDEERVIVGFFKR